MKKIETFLMGDSGPEVFFQLQENVFATLNETYFPAFLISDKCYKMLEEAQVSKRRKIISYCYLLKSNHFLVSRQTEFTSPSQGPEFSNPIHLEDRLPRPLHLAL